MAGFTPNLDDGELYLPSDIFPEEIFYTRQNPTNKLLKRSTLTTPKFPCDELTYMEDLTQQLATYALVEPNLSKQAPKSPPTVTQVTLFSLFPFPSSSWTGFVNTFVFLLAV